MEAQIDQSLPYLDSLVLTETAIVSMLIRVPFPYPKKNHLERYSATNNGTPGSVCQVLPFVYDRRLPAASKSAAGRALYLSS